MKKYTITYSYFDTAEDEQNDILSYAWEQFNCEEYTHAIESLYNQVENNQKKTMAAIYFIGVE